MKRKLIVGAGVGMCLAGYLVATAVGQSGAQPVTAIVSTLPDGRMQLTIHNISSVAITAYAVQATEAISRGQRGTTWLPDSTLARNIAPISAGKDYTMIVAQPGEHPDVAFRGALFQDGSSFGDAAWVQRLKNRRTYSQQALTAALCDLNALAPLATTPADLASRLNSQKQARISALPAAPSADQAYDRNDQAQMFSMLYPTVMSRITGGLCSDTTSMVECARAVSSQVQHSQEFTGAAN